MRDTRSASRLHVIAFMALSVALAAAGALIKLPSPVGTVALDSWPGYACALVVGPAGAWVALLGHLASSLVSGFPLGLTLHGVIALEMALCALAFRLVTRRLGVVPGLVAAAANATVASVVVRAIGAAFPAPRRRYDV